MTSFSTVAKLLSERLELDVNTILPDTELVTLGADSLTVAELMFDLEDEFDISFGDERPSLVIVQDIADNIDRLINNKPAA
ncbi:acyl carrier protein [Actimicrobium sp. GrIS 1.19]|uniref:phosphopantetheine-binding protein n=1 Tax=Actimicrobium sp. GrIS 1.19 TaxID=3071708 RepID=UPI002E0BAF98|nr:acyl carrier protein [Actimicrobium sp. GrIS 1.19]